MLRQLVSPKMKNIILVGLLIIILPIFVFFIPQSTHTNTGAPDQTVITFKSPEGETVKINQRDWADANRIAESTIENHARRLGVNPERISLGGLVTKTSIVNAAIDRAVLDAYAKKHGIQVTKDQAAESIKKQIPPESREQWLAEQARAGRSLDYWINMMQEQMLSAAVVQNITAKTRVSYYEAWLAYQANSQRINADIVRLNPRDYEAKVVTNDADLQKYFADNKAKYRVADQATYRYVIVRKDDLRSSATVTEADIAKAYDASREEFRTPRAALVSQITITKPNFTAESNLTAEEITSATMKARELASELSARIAKGEDFANIADMFNQEAELPQRDTSFDTTATDSMTTKGGNLGFITEPVASSFYGDEWTSSVFNARPGVVLPVIETPRGFHITKVGSVRDGIVQSLDKVRPVVEERLRGQQAETIFADIATTLSEIARTAPTLERIAQAAGLEVASTDMVDRKAAVIPGIGLLGDLAIPISDLTRGGRSEVLTDSNRHLIIELVEEFPAHDPELVTVRAKVENDYRAEKAIQLAKADAETLSKAGTTTETLRTKASDLGLTVTATGLFAMKEASLQLGQIEDFEKIAEGVRKNDVIKSTIGKKEQPQSFVVWLVTEKILPSQAEFTKDLPKVVKELTGRKQTILLNEFLRDARNSARKTLVEDSKAL